MTDTSIKYKHHTINFYNLLDEGHNPDTQIQSGTIYQRGDHNFDSLVNHLAKGSVIYDIGSYIGTFAIPMALEGMKVMAFEGFPKNVERLQKNCAAYPAIKVYEAALSNEKREVVTQFNDCRDEKEAKEDLIKYVLLDEFVEENSIPAPDFVKVDIEGMETLALFGMTNIIKNVKPIWQLCYHHNHPDKYSEYPGFVPTSEGGFDFTSLFEDYNIFCEGTPTVAFDRWGEYIMIPK
jgi:FkbM family methyltransferase